MKHQITQLSTERPRTVYLLVLIMTLALGALIPRIHVDTDPENMLPAEQPDRMFHNQVEQRFTLHDAIVVGAVNDSHPDGVFNPESLTAMRTLTDAILGMDGVIDRDLMSLSTTDNITQAGPGTVRFEWMMREAPQSRADALGVRDAVNRLPLLMNTLVSGDGKAAAIYVPIESKDLSYTISQDIQGVIETLDTSDEYHITGLPVAEDTFGFEMFVQMGISAPLAGVMLFLLMWYFFRSASLVVAPMLVAMATVISTMGLLIGLGFTVHIMSSMIPIFLMPIAVVDSVHIMSEFADRYHEGSDPREVVGTVIDELYKPMLFTSITSAVGFLSLMVTPIPPVQVFGAFVAFGILLAFLVTITLVPAYIVRMKPARLARLHALAVSEESDNTIARALRGAGRIAFSHPWPIVGVAVLIVAFSAVGISRIEINDNPVRWFKESHRIRVADTVLNQHFAGTYDAFLVLEHTLPEVEVEAYRTGAERLLSALGDPALATQLRAHVTASPPALDALLAALDDAVFEASDDDILHLEALVESSEVLQEAQRYFVQPEALQYIEALQESLMASGLVGKTNALPDITKVVNRELRGGEEADYRIPDSVPGVAQTLMQYQSSHRPQDLWHMVTPDYRSAAIWLQLTSGDNRDMTSVINAADDWLTNHPPPPGVDVRWAGKTFINVVWQQAMVQGMLLSLMSAFVIVFIMMVVLFRSPTFGLIAMLPLSLTIAFVYGLIGWIGKFYDMPVAVLSALTLGLSVDFAIHFVQRFRTLAHEAGSFAAAAASIFEEPARAIYRNAVVIALGFTPLFFAPLVPYITVGAFMASIMAISALVTLFLLPAVLALTQRALFKAGDYTAIPATNQGG